MCWFLMPNEAKIASEYCALAVKNLFLLVVKTIVLFVAFDVVDVTELLTLDDSVSERELVLLVTQPELDVVAQPVLPRRVV